MPDSVIDRPRSPVLVGLCAWIFPGLGYLVIGQRARALTVGVTIVLLFTAGLLIGGVRILEVPGYGPHGQRIEILRSSTGYVLKEHIGPFENLQSAGWALIGSPLDEIREKPWSIAQIMTGPISIVAGACAVNASVSAGPGLGPIGARSHSHIYDIGVLYTAVAGMLNLLAILDSAHRAANPSAGKEENALEPTAPASNRGGVTP